ncbi:MAG: T9SS type A sorting domain-containing protein [Bacteroidia bacterium]
MIQQADGQILLSGGNVDLNTEDSQKAFFRLKSDGTVDNAFGTNGLVALGTFDNDWVYDVQLQSTGKIIGLVTNDLNTTPAYVIRLLNTLNLGILETSPINDLGLYPNPVQSHFELKYELTSPQSISVHLIDAQGRMVHCFQENKRENGAQTHRFSLPDALASGIYVLSLRSASSVNNLQMIVR